MAKFTALKSNSFDSGLDYKIATNSLAVNNGDPIKVAAGFASLAVAGESIAGVAVTTKTFASDNQTVAQATLGYIPISVANTYKIAITWGTITGADVGKFYDLTAGSIVDGATESTTTGQVKMEEFISATLGVFSIVNL